MQNPSVLEIDLAAIDHNMRLLRRMVGGDCRICPVLKADAYGLGTERLAPRLQRAGAEMVAVYTPDQAAELLARGLTVPVLVLMPVREIGRADQLYRGLVNGRLHLTVHDLDHLADILQFTEQFGARANLHVEVDTGMSRGGCSPHEASALFDRIRSEPRLVLAGVFTHFACAEGDVGVTDEQLAEFDRLLERSALPDDCLVHAANTFAACRHRRFHKSMVRVGLAWAGYAAEMMSGRPQLAAATDLRPSVTWSSRIVHTRCVEAGRPVGYGHVWTARCDSRLALIPVGYADGYPYALGGSVERYRPAQVAVLIDAPSGQVRAYAPVVGAISMDQLAIDLTDIDQRQPEVAGHIGVGTTVELISADPDAPNHLPRLATAAGTLPHDVLCGLHPRIRRVYVEHELPIVHTTPQATAAGKATPGAPTAPVARTASPARASR